MKLRTMELSHVSSFKTVRRPVLKKKNGKKGEGCDTKNQKQLTLETLQQLTPFHAGVDMVTQAARNLLIRCIRVHPSVNTVFFSDAVKDSTLIDDDLHGFPIEKLAVSMVAETISKCNDKYKFHGTIERNKLDCALNDVYKSVHWKKLGFSLYTTLYPSVVRDIKSNISIQDYIDDNGPEWAEIIVETMTEPAWMMNWVKKIVRGQVTAEEYNIEMNALFVKLHLLDPQSVIPTYHLLNNMRALPGCNLELATHNYLGGPLDSDVFSREVKQAVFKESCPINVSKLSINDIELYFGVEVEEFVLSYVRDYGIWNGKRPDNKVKSKIQDRCSIM